MHINKIKKKIAICIELIEKHDEQKAQEMLEELYDKLDFEGSVLEKVNGTVISTFE